MLLIPAIDLKDGHCVRLKQGDMDLATVFSEDPADMALHWLKKGARRLHLVDLNGAFAGKPKNESAIKSILQIVQEYAEDNGIDEIPVQLGGGIRDLDTIERYLDDGISYIIVGTAAVKNPGFLHDLQDRLDGRFVLWFARKCAVQVDQVQAPRALLEPMQRHFGRIFGKHGGEFHIALLEANAVTVFQVDGGDQQHGRCR